jgi:hypothetical protein
VGQTNLHILKTKLFFSAFRRSEFSELQNLKISHIFFKFCARRFFFQKEWQFSGFGRKLLQSLRAEAGRRLNRKLSSKVFLEKSSSLIIKAAPDGKLRLRKRQRPLFVRFPAGVFVLESPVRLNKVQSSALAEQPIFCIFAKGETSKFSE